jgi:hypothetical protein
MIEIACCKAEDSREISGSHGGEYEVKSLLGCTAVFSNRCRPTFQRYVLPPSSGQSSVDIDLRTRQYIPEDSVLQKIDDVRATRLEHRVLSQFNF